MVASPSRHCFIKDSNARLSCFGRARRLDGTATAPEQPGANRAGSWPAEDTYRWRLRAVNEVALAGPQGAGDSSGGHVRRDSSIGLIRPTSFPSGSATIAYRAPQKASNGRLPPRVAGGHQLRVPRIDRLPGPEQEPDHDPDASRIGAPARVPQPRRLDGIQLQAEATRHSQLHMGAG